MFPRFRAACCVCPARACAGQGCLGMKVGEKRRLTMGADEGYGANGFPAWQVKQAGTPSLCAPPPSTHPLPSRTLHPPPYTLHPNNTPHPTPCTSTTHPTLHPATQQHTPPHTLQPNSTAALTLARWLPSPPHSSSKGLPPRRHGLHAHVPAAMPPCHCHHTTPPPLPCYHATAAHLPLRPLRIHLDTYLLPAATPHCHTTAGLPRILGHLPTH